MVLPRRMLLESCPAELINTVVTGPQLFWVMGFVYSIMFFSQHCSYEVQMFCWFFILTSANSFFVNVHWFMKFTGTSACPDGKFYCQNVGHSPLTLFSSRVNDGICGKKCCRFPPFLSVHYLWFSRESCMRTTETIAITIIRSLLVLFQSEWLYMW